MTFSPNTQSKFMFQGKFRTMLILGALLLFAGTTELYACPMCKTATEAGGDKAQPAAYMASILTMLSMPTVLFTVLGVSIYRMTSQEQEIADELTAESQMPRSSEPV